VVQRKPKYTGRRILLCAVVLVLFGIIGFGMIYLATGFTPVDLITKPDSWDDVGEVVVNTAENIMEQVQYNTVYDTVAVDYPEQFFVEVSSYFEPQIPTQCAGFAAAYILRCFGQEAEGTASYEQMNNKMDNGYVRIPGIVDFLNKRGIPSQYRMGTTEQMKTRLAAGSPVIVLIGNADIGRHFITILGYDSEYIYAYDSNKSTDNSKGYNRTFTDESFKELLENKNSNSDKLLFYLYIL